MRGTLVILFVAVVVVIKAESELDQITSLLSFRPLALTDEHIAKRSVRSGLCNPNEIVQKIIGCGLIIQATDLSTYGLKEFCSHTECKLQCAQEVLGSCYKEDAFFAWEPLPTKVAMRGQCENQTATLSFLEGCLVTGRSRQCVLNMAKEYMDVFKTYWLNGEYSLFRERYCSVLETFRNCVDFSHCTDAERMVGQAYMDGTAFSKCNMKQIGYLFRRYAGEPNC